MDRHRLAQLGLLMSLVLSVATAGLPARAHSQQADYTHPTWWSKFQAVSAPGFKPLEPRGGRSGLTVGGNVDVSNEPGPESETSIAINPDAPSEIVAGSNEIFRLPMRAYASSNDGASWAGVDLPLPPPRTNNGFDFGSDPSVVWGPHGTVYYSYIVVFWSKGFLNCFNCVNGSEMAVARSSDGGTTWKSTYFNFFKGSKQFNDKPMITVDTERTSPFFGRVYVAWDTGGSSSGGGTKVSFSDNGGRTFSSPKSPEGLLAGQHLGVGAIPYVAPGGTLHVAWIDLISGTLVDASSADGGRTFGPKHVVAPISAGFDYAVPAQASRRVLVYPSCDADASVGPHRGTLYCTWNDLTAANGSEVFLSRSTDGGATWSSPVRVSDDQVGVVVDQFYPWLAVDPTNGSVDISWYDTRNDSTRVSADVFFTRSTNGALTFAKNIQVTTEPTNEAASAADAFNQYGDYEGLDAFGGEVHPVWTDRRASLPSSLNEEVFTARIH